MKRLNAFAALMLAATLIASVGCARWTILPRTPGSPTADGKRMGPKNLMQAMRSSDTNAESQPGQQRQVAGEQQNGPQHANDLATLDPALAIARLTERQGDPGDAKRQYLRYIEKHPEHPVPHHRLGVMAAKEAKYEEAEARFTKAAQLSKPSAELLSDLGYLYYLQSRMPEAERLLRQASQLEPSNQTVHNNLALVLGAKGNFDESLRNFRRVNEEGQARANLAYSLSQNGQLDNARAEYLNALTLDNQLNNAAKALLQVEEARKREQTAIGRHQEALGDDLIELQSHTAPAGPQFSQARRQVTAPPARRTAAQQASQFAKRESRPQGDVRFAQQALMPIPTGSSQPQPQTSHTTVGTRSRLLAPANTGVQQASHVEAAPAARPANSASLQDDWRNLSSPSQPSSVGTEQRFEQPAPKSEKSGSGYSISIGG